MFGIDVLSASALLVLASAQKPVCPAHDPTAINVIPRTEDVEFDTSQTLKEIQNYNMDTVDPYGFHGKSITQAFMSGGIERKHQVKLNYGPIEGYRNAVCIWYEDITVELSIDPTIVVASELYDDRCMRGALIDHEMKHIRVDRELVNEHARAIGQKLMSELKSRGFSSGPISGDNAQSVAKKMHHVVGQILQLEYQKLDIDRLERQRAVDNLDEYNRVDDICPDFRKKKKELYSDLVE
ncbi:MAG: hypothetical protein KDI13_00025 [Alphaproteobacteria bacterium]|nr:hypothetical protein [Alphaproteobacteria bacterium]